MRYLMMITGITIRGITTSTTGDWCLFWTQPNIRSRSLKRERMYYDIFWIKGYFTKYRSRTTVVTLILLRCQFMAVHSRLLQAGTDNAYHQRTSLHAHRLIYITVGSLHFLCKFCSGAFAPFLWAFRFISLLFHCTAASSMMTSRW